MKKTGFTLLELLVVIAIIGILAVISSVVYNDYREKARQEGVAMNLIQARRVANVISSTEHTYEGLCEEDDYLKIRNEAQDINHGKPVTCTTSGDNFCVSTEVVEGAKHYCLDATGFSGFITSSDCNDEEGNSVYVCQE